MAIEKLREQLSERVSTAYGKMDRMIDIVCNPEEANKLKLTRPEKVAVVAQEIYRLAYKNWLEDGQKGKYDFSRDFDKELRVIKSRAFLSANAKINRFREVVREASN